MDESPEYGKVLIIKNFFMLDELDKELEARGHKFCRFADDVNIYVKTLRAGKRVFNSITNYLQKRLKLNVNQDKSATKGARSRKFLGFGILGYKVGSAI